MTIKLSCRSAVWSSLCLQCSKMYCVLIAYRIGQNARISIVSFALTQWPSMRNPGREETAQIAKESFFRVSPFIFCHAHIVGRTYSCRWRLNGKLVYPQPSAAIECNDLVDERP
ncbi:uncharacterized protein LAESUDRAFT_548931 [Laetiporus sulphureus 93-53]|uniref:Uncharacterized protein n=1 Tax=Laetiporus sulphureus 93-53 TaxID=1314785 RepID=A0A165FS46_9APHY|nr:uncharacterized protein LAESUDRAFT_548931 [Laetiporus sulphureus 93-53]KZT09340.1 hypothetical protein LAESUDRAFT_548931 [Laetiporus sulphureus 93-53]